MTVDNVSFFFDEVRKMNVDQLPLVLQSVSTCRTIFTYSNRYFSLVVPASVAQWAERRTRDREVPGSKLACATWFFPQARKLNRHCQVAHFARNAHWAEPSPLFAERARPTPLKCTNEYLVLPLGEETAVQAVVGSVVWAFRRLKKPRCREMSARGYALHSVCPNFLFFVKSYWKYQ